MTHELSVVGQIGQGVPQTGQWALKSASNKPRLGNKDPTPRLLHWFTVSGHVLKTGLGGWHEVPSGTASGSPVRHSIHP